MKENLMYVTTDSDLWNSADEAHFFVTKGQVKKLPEVLTPIIEDGLLQGLLREATTDEINKQEFNNEIEQALINRQIVVGKNFEETIENFKQLKKSEKPKIPIKEKTNITTKEK